MTNEITKIEQLRDEAASHGDLDQVALCDLALSGDDAAKRKCLRVIVDAVAMDEGNTTLWNKLTLYGFDIAECDFQGSRAAFIEALREYRESGTMAGFYFSEAARDAGADEDADAVDVTPNIDWTGFEQYV